MTETSWLSAACLGDVVAPPADRHRRRWGLGPGWHGSLVFARCEHDVVAAVRTGIRSGGGVLARSGPCADPSAEGAEVVVVTAGLDHVEIDPGARQAHVGVGATWREVARAAAAAGLAPVAGDDPDTAVGVDVLAGHEGPWCRSLGPVAASVTAVDAVSADGRLVRLDPPAGFGGVGAARPPVPTSVRLRLVPAFPVTVVRARDLGTPTAASVHRWLDAVGRLPAGVASALVVPARADAPVVWWAATRGPATAPDGWPGGDLEVSRRPVGTTLRWPPAPGRGPGGTAPLGPVPVDGSTALADLLTAGRRGALVLRHRGADPDGQRFEVHARGVEITRLRHALRASESEVGLVPSVAGRP